MAKKPNYMRPTHQSQRRAKNRTTIDCSRCNRCKRCGHGETEAVSQKENSPSKYQANDSGFIQLPQIAEIPNPHDNGHGHDELPPDQIPTSQTSLAEPPTTPTEDLFELPQAEGDLVQTVDTPHPTEEHPAVLARDDSPIVSADSESDEEQPNHHANQSPDESRTSTISCGPTRNGRNGIKVRGNPGAIPGGEVPLDSLPFWSK